MIHNLLITAAVSAALGAGGAWAWQGHQYERQLAELRSEHAQQVAAAESQRADLQAKHRATEQELQNAQAAHAAEIETLQRDTARARTAAAAAGDSLRRATAAAAQRARAQCADATTAQLRPPANDAIDVLADVLGRIDARAQELADIAEQRGIAGRACEREYDSAREALSR